MQGEGAIFALRDARAGAEVEVTTAGGRTLRYTVVTTGAPRLTLVTCRGTFDSTVRSYEDNMVVAAVPA